MTNVVARSQAILAGSRAATRASSRLAGFLDGIVYRRLGHDVDPVTNGEFFLVDSLGGAIAHFIDVGANVGAWSSYVVDVAPTARGILIEPGSTAAHCRKRFALNAGVEVIECAAGDRTGDIAFAEDLTNSETSSVVRIAAQSTIRQVPVDTLTSIVERAGWWHIDIVKCDAEGYDFQVVSGSEELLSSQRIGVFQFEYNDSWMESGATLDSALKLFGKHGYEVVLIARGGLWKYRYVDYGEFYHHSNFAAIAPAYIERLSSLVIGTA